MQPNLEHRELQSKLGMAETNFSITLGPSKNRDIWYDSYQIMNEAVWIKYLNLVLCFIQCRSTLDERIILLPNSHIDLS